MKMHYTYFTKEATKEFSVEIKVSTAFQFFFAGAEIPEEIQGTYTGVILKRFYFDDINSLNDKVRAIIADYESTFVEETKKKVIVYEIGYEQRRGHYLNFNYKVVQKIEFKKRGRDGKPHTETRYFEERSRRESFSGLNQVGLEEMSSSEFKGDFSEMPWSKEREVWFEQMSVNIEQLGLRLVQGFGKKAELLAMKIDQGGLANLLEGKNGT